MEDLISIIIPVYNVEKHLDRCINSILNQSYKNLEIIMIDDGSSDSSGMMCDEYAKLDNRIRVIHKTNGGVSSARNAGLDIANGNYIGFVDSDDYISENMYEVLLDEIKSGDYSIAECNYYRVYEDGTHSKRENKDAVYDGYKDIWYASLTDYLSNGMCNKLIKKTVIGNLRFNTDYKIAEDMLLFFECAKNGKTLIFVNKPLYYYYQREDSAMHKPFYKGAFDTLEVLEKFEADCDNEKLTKAWMSYYLPNLISVSQKIINTGLFIEKASEIRSKIVKRKKDIFSFKPLEINSRVRSINIKNKLYVLFIWLCPMLVYKLYPSYLHYRRKRLNKVV